MNNPYLKVGLITKGTIKTHQVITATSESFISPLSFVSRDLVAIKRFHKDLGEIIIKPLYGNGGEGVFKLGSDDPNLSVKIPFHYNRFQTDIFSEKSSDVNLFQIQGFTPMKCDIYADKIWKMNDKFHMKWKCKSIQLV